MAVRATFTGLDSYKLNGVTVTDQVLGHGAYATVIELKYIGLKCAGKKIHELLLDQGGASYSVRRFEEECRLLSQVRHPNVVQFLGVHFQQRVQAPILVMEFLPTNLTSCIEQYGILPKEISYSILCDVALGLCYLHSQTPPIIHRDLSSNNVLLTPNMTAKISDLGVARILNLTPLQVSRMTQTPGTPAFMPPEVMIANPNYDTSVDEFSYGILMIHIFSGRWPEPQVGPIRTEPGKLIPVTEAERREVFLRAIGNKHPLMDLILKCIDNHPQTRAHTCEIVERLAEMVLQFPASFANRLEMQREIEHVEEEKQALREEREAENQRKYQQIVSLRKEAEEKDEEIVQLNLVYSSEVEQLKLQLRVCNAQIHLLSATNEADVTELKTKVAVYEDQIEKNAKLLQQQKEDFETQQDRDRKNFEAEMETKIVVYEDQIKKKGKILQEHKEAFETLQAKMASKREEFEMQLTKERESCKMLRNEIRQLEAELSESVVNATSLKHKISNLEAERSTKTAIVERNESQLKAKTRALEEKEAIISGMREQLTSTTEHLTLTHSSQHLKTTSMLIQNRFNVREVVTETQVLIEDGKLLEAYRNLADLERTRDELLILLYHSDDSYTDKNENLHHYFEPLITLSDSLGQQLWLVMSQAAYLVTKEPNRVIAALRIIEREEKMDSLLKEALEEKGVPSSHLPGRPKNWKDKCMQMMEIATTNKIEGLHPQEQEILENKAWLTEYLSAVASVCYTDLQSIRDKGRCCFPPTYKIMDFFVQQYHKNLVKVISDLVNRGLNARDIIGLMVWIGDVRASFRETLEIDFQDYGPLIDPSIEKGLQGTCQVQVESNVKDLVQKMLDAEKEEWDGMQPPEQDVGGAYYTTLGITLFQMIEQNIAALAPLGEENKLKVLSLCLEAVQDFQRKIIELVDNYYKGHLQTQRRMPPHFIEYMIATANNCRACMEFAERLRKKFCLERNENMLDAEYEIAFKKIKEDFDGIGHQCCDYLMNIVMMDLQPIFAGLFTKDAWFANPGELVDKVEGTLLDYDTDFQLLKQAYHSYVVVEAQHKVMLAYMKAMMQKRMVFKKDKEREKAAKMIRDEARRTNTLFLRLSHATNPKYTQVLELLAELLNSKHEYLPMDIMGLVNKHPDIRANHVLAVLAMRGDLNKSGVKKIIEQTPLIEQGGGGASGGASTDEERKYSSAALKKRLEERNLLAQLVVPNPYSMFGR